jgi:hypothetical protein
MLKVAAALALVSLACLGQARRPLVREEVRVGQETWRPEWKKAPVEACGPNEGSFTCPCDGFRYGQAGDLDLVRIRAGRVLERLALGAFFEGQGHDAVVRLHDQMPDDWKTDDTKLAAEVARRPAVKVMKLSDYNHDGHATEFYLQTGAGPCGWVAGIVIGTTSANPTLHAFGTARDSKTPLVMRGYEWDALRDSNGKAQMTHLPCGDHGAEEQIERTITATARGIVVVDQTYQCTEDDEKGKFLGEETF